MAEAADFMGTSPSPARRWLRRTGALFLSLPLLATATLPLASGAAAAPEAPAPQAVDRTKGVVDVSVDALTPTAPDEDDTLTVRGTLTNTGKQTITDGRVDLLVGQPLRTRSALDAAERRTAHVPGVDGTPVGGKYVQEIDELGPGRTRDFSISVPVKELDLGTDAVYQLGIALTGSAAQSYGQVLGIERAFLPWQPEDFDAKAKTAFLWPLISTTHLTAETSSNDQQTRVFEDDGLAKEIGPGGRLQQMLDLGSSLDVTWVIDPDLLASVAAMAEGYRIKDGDRTIAGKNRAVAGRWLTDLQEAVRGETVVALPFADPDLASLAHRGKNVSGSLSHLKSATDVAALTVETTLHVKPVTNFAWPAEGAVDPSVIDVATSAGADTVIARSDSLSETGNLPYTPSAARPIGDGTTAVVADARLSKVFRGDLLRAEDSALAVQEFLAHSLMISLQDPGEPRSIVVAPQRMPSGSQAQAMAKAIQTLQTGRWTELQELTAAAKAEPDPGATTRVPSARAYSERLRKQELNITAFQQIQRTQRKLDDFSTILTAPHRVVTPFGLAIHRGMSTSWRGRTAEGNTFREGVEEHLITLMRSVQLIDKSDAQLSGRSATIPVTVKNNLVQGVDNLRLRLTSTKPKRLKIGDEGYDEQPVKLAGERVQTLKFDTNANANGIVDVEAQLFTADGTQYGETMRFRVQVNEVTPTVMLVIAGGLLLLVLAGFRMYHQRKRAARREAEQAGATPGDADEGTEPAADPRASTGDDAPRPVPRAGEPEQPSDPAPDTAAESTDPSGPGERVDR
ncbi:DUF6049 family protein [Streptomyces sp. NPDC002490]|uniref:DUF6049 family protein n=1 Tax=Streptomyces sp. NPDC002490 TaxID=3154416 RepID=UPI003319B51D